MLGSFGPAAGPGLYAAVQLISDTDREEKGAKSEPQKVKK